MRRPRRLRKRYTPPRLVRYGDVKRLTRTQAKGGSRSDAGGNPTPTRL